MLKFLHKKASHTEAASANGTTSTNNHVEDVGVSTTEGMGLLRNPKLNKGLAFTEEERKKYKIEGLIPPRVETQEEQLERELHQLRKKSSQIEKFMFLMTLLNRNSQLFYKLVIDNVQEVMPLVYTPTVGQACIEYSENFAESQGIYIRATDKGNISRILDNWPEKNVKVIVVTDGERILGLGDLGSNGMGIPVGKLMLYSAIGGIDPATCLPVTIDVGTETESIRKDKFYTGLRQPRVRGPEYEALIMEFFEAASKKFGRQVLIQFEDFGNSTAFHLLEMTREKFCTFNDDIQGTAAVSLAGVIASLDITKNYENGAKRLSDHVILFFGAGEAGTGIASMIADAINEESARLDGKPMGLDLARKNIWLVDSKGLVHSGCEKLAHHKIPFAHPWSHGSDPIPTTLLDAVKSLKATCLIGVSAQPQTFTKEICEEMAKNAVRPVIFALSNPTTKAECTAAQAYGWTQGRCLYASGSPFDPVDMKLSDVDPVILKDHEQSGDDVVFEPGQGNNAYIFPGLGLGVIASGALTIPNAMLLESAYALAKQVKQSDLRRGSLYPPLKEIRKVSTVLAAKVAERAYEIKVATNQPKPSDLLAYCESLQFKTSYDFIKR